MITCGIANKQFSKTNNFPNKSKTSFLKHVIVSPSVAQRLERSPYKRYIGVQLTAEGPLLKERNTTMGKLPRGFISLGSKESWLNVDCIDQDKSYLDKRINKVAVIDKFGNRFNVDPKLCIGRIKWRE